jgi:hypothetical protein
MKSVRYEGMGVTRSYYDFFMGFGHSLTVTMLMQTILLWQLASLARTNALGVRPLVAVIALATAAGGVIAWTMLIPIPAYLSVVLVATLATACAVAK